MAKNDKIMMRIVWMALLLAPSAAFADLDGTLGKIEGWLERLIPIFMTLAVLAFLWGLVKFIAHAEDEQAQTSGKNLMVWGMIALFVMVAFWGIIAYVQSSLDLTGGTITTGTPPTLNTGL